MYSEQVMGIVIIFNEEELVPSVMQQTETDKYTVL